MTGRTHFILGANSIWLAYLIASSDPWLAVLPLLGALAGLLPDIDTRQSELAWLTSGSTRLLLIDKLFRHRSFTHSLLALPFIAALSYPMLKLHPLAPLVFVAGYTSHPFIDGFNPQGCEYFYPNKTNYRLIPKFLCVDTGGWVDRIIFYLGVLSLILFYLVWGGVVKITVI